MDQQAPSLTSLCQALIAHDTCAALVLDPDGRVLACNASAGIILEHDGQIPRGGSLAESASPQAAAAIRTGMELVCSAGAPSQAAVKTPLGELAVAALRVDDRVTGFVVRRVSPEPLAAELAATRTELEAARAALSSSWAEVAAANAALRTANEDLQRQVEQLQAVTAADRHKDEFLAMLAHELRTPLAPILSAVQILRRQAADNPMVQRAREVVERQAMHQARLLDDLLDVSRITRGKVELRRRAVNLGVAMLEALEATRALIQAKAQHIVVSPPEQPVWVDADPTRLTQILTNLVNNAAKYTHAGGRIAVSCTCDGGQAIVVVRDNGSGIPPEMLSRIFDLFAQAEPASARTHGGLGIGLTLVKNLIEMHGGTVVARSRGRGSGSEFEIRLPTVAAPGVEEPAPRGGVQGRTYRVLLVEDNSDTRETLRHVLELDGHAVQEAADGRQAIELALATRPEVVIVDIGLPGLDGLEVARRLRASFGGQVPRLVALTGYGQAEDRQMSRDAGFDVHLVKPVSPEQLAVALETRRTGEAA